VEDATPKSQVPFSHFLIVCTLISFLKKPAKRKSKKMSDEDQSISDPRPKRTRKVMTAEEWMIDSTVNLQPDNTLIEELALERAKAQAQEKLLHEKEAELKSLKSKTAAALKEYRNFHPSPKDAHWKDRPPSSTSDDTSISTLEPKIPLPQRKIRPLMALANVDTDDSASESPSLLSIKPRRSVCLFFSFFFSTLEFRSSRVIVLGSKKNQVRAELSHSFVVVVACRNWRNKLQRQKLLERTI
jgi:hypothetical protein